MAVVMMVMVMIVRTAEDSGGRPHHTNADADVGLLYCHACAAVFGSGRGTSPVCAFSSELT